MATSTPIFPQTIINPVLMINDSNGVNILPFWTGSVNGDKIESISIASTDTNANTVNLYMNVGNVNYQMGQVAVPATAGTDGATSSVNPLSSSALMPWVRNDSNGRSYLYVANGSILSMAAKSIITAGKRIHVVGQGGSF